MEKVLLAISHIYNPSFSQDPLDLSCTSREVIPLQNNLEGTTVIQYRPSSDISCLVNVQPRQHTWLYRQP